MWLGLLITAAAGASPLLWPLPQNVSVGSTELWLPADFAFVANPAPPSPGPLETAFATYGSIIFPTKSFPAGPAATKLATLVVAVSNFSLDLNDMNESYQLVISPGSPPTAQLTAPSVWGALRGLETFTQGVKAATSSSAPVLASPVHISDRPRFPWRGFMIDTSRSFIPVSVIQQVLVGMSYLKLNVLHWHSTDTQSFPLANDAYPELTKGAFSPSEVYSSEDQAAVVAFAKARGIRVVLEMDVPGHALSWGAGIPEIVAKDCPAYSHNINNIPLDPTNEATLKVVTGVFADRAKVFGDKYLHLGGDEVVFGCWENITSIVKWMREHGMTQGVQLERWFEGQLLSSIASLDRLPIVWVEIFQNGNALPKGAVVQCWKDNSVLADVVNAGLGGLVSHGWYLSDPGSWQDAYAVEPLQSLPSPSPKQLSLALGGEACVWGPVTGTVPPVMEVAFPRLLAVAERLWSAKEVTDPKLAEPRYDAMWCELLQRHLPIPSRSC